MSEKNIFAFLHCIWRFRRGLSAIQRGERDREHRESAGSRGGVDEQKFVRCTPNRSAREGVPSGFLKEIFHRILLGRCIDRLAVA
jgi:hypothetical protein